MQRLMRLLGIAGMTLGLIYPAIAGLPTASKDREDPKIFTPIDDGSLPLLTMKSEDGMPFEKFVRFQANAQSFIYASTAPEGTGAFMTENIFWIAPDRTIHPVSFEHAGRAYENKVTEGEFVLTGGPGILFSKGRLLFEFLIANYGDPQCCPTAGRISGTYKMIGEKEFDAPSKTYSSTFKLVVDRCRRYIESPVLGRAGLPLPKNNPEQATQPLASSKHPG